MRQTRGAGRPTLVGVLLLVAMLAPTRSLLAQRWSGTVRDSASQAPLPGAVVLVLDPSGRPAARNTTDPQGRFRLFPPASRATARLRLRVLRMGFRPYERPLSATDAGTSIEVGLTPFPVQLEEFQVVSAPSCPRRPDRAAAMALLQQVRMALYAPVVARSRNAATMTRLLYARRFDGAGGGVVSQTVRARVTSATNESFSAARSAAAFGRQGFREDSTGSHTYLGPDAETLIDEAFTESYCFRIVTTEGVRPRQVGLRFEPADRVDGDGRLDVVGTLWVDTLSRVLRDLTFRYVGLDRETSALAPEGRLSFRELPNGVVIIDQWSLRLGREPGAAGRIASVTRGDDAASGTPRLRAQEIGGEIARATWTDGFSWNAPLGAIRLRAVDRQGRPAVGSVVQLVDTDHKATTDASGMSVLTGLLPGPYVASVRDPRLAALDVPPTAGFRFAAVRDSTIDGRIEVETADEFAGRRCAQELSGTGKAWLLGRVVTADGRPVGDARWTLRDDVGSALVESGRVDADGFFHWCQLSMNKSFSIDVSRDERRTSASRVVSDRVTTLRLVLPP